MNVLLSPTRPSETQSGIAFVDKFKLPDQSVARLLVDSLEIHNFSNILNALRDEVLRNVRLEEESPAVLIPVRSKEDLPDIQEDVEHVAYKTFLPGQGFSSMPGSEGEIGSIIATLTGQEPARFLPPTVGIDEIRDLKVRNIVLLTDYCGSGTQALRFARMFLRNSRVASWVSSGHLKLRVQSYASSSSAVDLFAREKGVHFSTLVAAKSGPATSWSDAQAAAIRTLCLEYAEQDLQEEALGYKDSFGLYLSSFRVPNNLPQILIRSEGPWPGLFPARRVPSEFSQELSSYVPTSSVSQVLRNIGESELARFVDQAGRPRRVGLGLAAMSLLGKGADESEVVRLIGLKPQEWKNLRSTLIALNLVDFDLHLTNAGHAELRRSRLWSLRDVSRGNSAADVAPIEYFPTQLR